MKEFCVIGCGKNKVWDEEPETGGIVARLAYRGRYFEACREYVENFYPENWCILSAKYGFILPDEIIPGNYDCTFKNTETNPIGAQALSESAGTKKLKEYDRILVVAGKEYFERTRRAIPQAVVISVLEGRGPVGKQMQALKKAVRQNIRMEV